MPTFLDIQESQRFCRFLSEQLHFYFTMSGFTLVNHTRTPEMEVFEFEIDSAIVSMLLRKVDMEHVRVIIEAEEKVEDVRRVIEDALVQTVMSITDKVFDAYVGDPQRLRVRLVSWIRKRADEAEEEDERGTGAEDSS